MPPYVFAPYIKKTGGRVLRKSPSVEAAKAHLFVRVLVTPRANPAGRAGYRNQW